MTPRRNALAIACLLAAGATHAADGNTPTAHRASLAWQVDAPNRGLDDWQAFRAEIASTPGPWQRAWRAAAVAERRFGSDDQGIELGFDAPLNARWLLQSDVGIAPGADFLPRQSVDVRLVRRFEDAVLVSGGLRSARYRDDRAERALLSLERYAGNWRFAGTGTLTRVDGRQAPGLEFAADRYRGDRDSIGVRLSRGKDLVPLPSVERSFSDVRTAALVGRHWLRPRWGLEWAVGYVDQRGLYDRGWLRLGLLRGW